MKLKLHGGKSVQKNLCPFFFFFGLPVSPSILSASEPPSPSPSSDSSISTSCDPNVCMDLSEFPRLSSPRWILLAGWFGDDEKELLKGDRGRGLCPSMPAKLSLVGVVSAEPSVDGTMWGRSDVVGSARGVVGVVASVVKSVKPRPTLTEWKVVVMTMSLNGLTVE